MARQTSPQAQLTTLADFNTATGALGTATARHPYRYFVAAGESLKLIEDAISDAAAYPANMRALAAANGASTIEFGRFFFTDSTVDTQAPTIKLAMHHGQFIADPQTPDMFLPNPHAHNSADLHAKLARLRDATGVEAENLKKELIRQTNTKDIVNGGFVFMDYDMHAEKIVFTPPPRLRANPLFILSGEHPRGFEPDPATQAGLDLTQRVMALAAQRSPLQRVMKAFGAWEVNTDPHGHPRFKDNAGRPNEKLSGKCEKIDGEWIIAIPVVGTGRYGANGEGGSLSGYQEDIAVPPGAVPISIADYFTRLEKRDMLSFAGTNALPAPK